MLGKEYIIDLAGQIYVNREEQKAFQNYQSELLRALNNNIAQAIGGVSFPKSWKEITEYKPETRTASEIKTTILDKLHKLGGE